MTEICLHHYNFSCRPERQEIHRSIEPERLEETIRIQSGNRQALLQTALDVLMEV